VAMTAYMKDIPEKAVDSTKGRAFYSATPTRSNRVFLNPDRHLACVRPDLTVPFRPAGRSDRMRDPATTLSRHRTALK
jgi:hypothetical protein